MIKSLGYSKNIRVCKAAINLLSTGIKCRRNKRWRYCRHFEFGKVTWLRVTNQTFFAGEVTIAWTSNRAEQRLRMPKDGRGLGSKLVSFAKGFSKHPHILVIFMVDSGYLRFPFKVKVDYFILYSILVSTFVIFLLLFSMNKRRRTKEASPL